MQKNNRKCPMCGRKLKPENGRMVCKDCGYSLRTSDNYDTSGFGHADANKWENSASFHGSFDYGGDHMKKNPAKPDANMENSIRRAKIIISLVAGLVSVAAVLSGLYSVFRLAKVSESTMEYNGNVISQQEWNRTGVLGAEERYLPESELFQQFVSDIYGKSYQEISEKEYAELTGIHMYYYEDRIDYMLGDGEIQEYFYDGSLYGRTSDLKCFTGLKYLNVEGNSLSAGDLDGLDSLTEVHAGNSPEELTYIIEKCEKIQKLGIYDTFFSRSLQGIENFPNLTGLYVEADYIEDISGISVLNKLEELTIEAGNNISNFGELADVNTLTKLSITSARLKNLSFLSGMNQLEELAVNESEIADISMLSEHKDTLTKVEFFENYEVKDYSVIGELTRLESVGIGCGYDDILPSFGKMDELSCLSLEGVGDISVIGTAKNLTELTLKRCSLTKLSGVSALTSLKYLRIDDSSSYIGNLHPLMTLVNLEKLDISNTSVFGNVEELFSLPALSEFDMDECRVSLDFEKIPGNENLKVLRMNNTAVVEYDTSESNGFASNANAMEVNLSEYLEMFMNFPNLTELYIAGDKVDNLEFAAGLKNLRRLDITDNYVSSLEPLADLQNLEIVWCGQNTITNDGGLGDKVRIIEY